MLLLRSEPRQPVVEEESYLFVYSKKSILERLSVYGVPNPFIKVHWKTQMLQLFGVEFHLYGSDFISLPHLLWLPKFNLGVEKWLRSLNIEVEDIAIKARYLGAPMSLSALLKITATFAVRKDKKNKLAITTLIIKESLRT
jgi:hypothetical protein